MWSEDSYMQLHEDKFDLICTEPRQQILEGWGGGQPDSDMKVDSAEIGIGKIGISDFFNLKLPILANFGKIGNKIFLEFPIFYSISATFIGVFVPILAKKVL